MESLSCLRSTMRIEKRSIMRAMSDATRALCASFSSSGPNPVSISAVLVVLTASNGLRMTGLTENPRLHSWLTAKVSTGACSSRCSFSRSSFLNSNGSIGSIIGRPRLSSMRRAASIMAPIPDSYIWMVRLDTPAISAMVPRLIPMLSRVSLRSALSSLTYSPPGAAKMNGGESSSRRSASVSLDTMDMLNLE